MLKNVLLVTVGWFVLGCTSAQAQDLALTQPATASSTEGELSQYRPANANDGNSSTRWSSEYQNNQWWQVDLGSIRSINRVELNWHAAYARHYRIRTRASTSSPWSTATRVTISSPGLKTHTFSTRNARYVRIQGDRRGTQWGISLWDARVCNISCSGPAPPPPADADGDGVSDANDGCPSEPGPASNGGCPLPSDPPTAEFRIIPSPSNPGQQVTFDWTGSCPANPCSFVWEDEGSDGPGGSDWPLGTGDPMTFTFSGLGTKFIHIVVTDDLGRTAEARKNHQVVEPPPPSRQCSDGVDNADPEDTLVDLADPGCSGASDDDETDPAPPPPPPRSGCESQATNATTATQVRNAVLAGQDVCVTTNVGNVDLSVSGNAAGVVVSTNNGSLGSISLGLTNLTIRNARFQSITLRGAHGTTLENNTIGGAQSNRVLDQLVFIPCCSDDVTIRGNDIGWTNSDSSGNTGYGIRVHGGSGASDRLKIIGNRIHDIAADGIQGLGQGVDDVIDRNEVGPVGSTPGSNEHSDNIQIIDNGPNLRITNNWIHHQGYYNGQVVGNAGATYIHGGSTGTLLYENNLIDHSRGRVEVCGLGTGGTSRSNITVRRNTFSDNGQTFSSFPGFEWDCDSGSGNRVERNIAVDPDGGFAQNGSSSAAVFSSNLFGQPPLVTLDSQGNCTSSNCNASGQEPIGYRKPAGVNW
jgi:hypothetical protein